MPLTCLYLLLALRLNPIGLAGAPPLSAVRSDWRDDLQTTSWNDGVEAYWGHHIWFDGPLTYRRTIAGQEVALWSRAYEGLERRPLDGARLYEKLGREDLAAAYRHRRAARLALLIGGAATAAGGAALMLGALLGSDDPSFSHDGTIAGFSLMLIGTLATTAGRILKADPLSPGEVRREAERYNERMRRELELSDGPHDGRRRVTIVPIAGRYGGGLAGQIAF